MTDETELKPCPLCQPENGCIDLIEDEGKYTIVCSPLQEGEGCGLTLRDYLDKENLIKTWNTRATTTNRKD